MTLPSDQFAARHPAIGYTLWLVACVLAVALQAGPVWSQPIDPHTFFEERCSRCHTEHARDFVQKSVTLAPDGGLFTRETSEPIEDFLPGHPGRPSDAAVAALAEMFRLQLRTGGLFRAKCTVCHKSARGLARKTLARRDGHVVGRYTDRDMSEFLASHGRLSEAEAAIIHEMLAWQLAVAGR